MGNVVLRWGHHHGQHGAEVGLPSWVPRQGCHLRCHSRVTILGTVPCQPSEALIQGGDLGHLVTHGDQAGGCGATPHAMAGALGDFPLAV